VTRGVAVLLGAPARLATRRSEVGSGTGFAKSAVCVKVKDIMTGEPLTCSLGTSLAAGIRCNLCLCSRVTAGGSRSPSHAIHF